MKRIASSPDTLAYLIIAAYFTVTGFVTTLVA